MTSDPTLRLRDRVVVTRDLPAEGVDLVREVAEVDVWGEATPPPRDELLARVAGCAGILVTPTERVDDELLDAAGPGLRALSTYSVGFDHVDVSALVRRGIPCGHTPGVLTETTADMAWALLMAAARRITEAERHVRAGRWSGWGIYELLGVDVHGATLGIVGFGRIGRAVARRAIGFDMTVLYASRSAAPPEVERDLHATRVPLDELLERADFVSVHAPYGPETHHLIDATALARMKPTAILVNTARGGLVDSEALLAALEAGRIRAAALDVTDPEPMPADHPLARRDDCIVVPHLGSATLATRTRMAVVAARNLVAGLRGEPMPHAIPGTQPSPAPGGSGRILHAR
jgi:lactate dehydrogenase-like 2-hydroxyacid dehydrogenase